MDFKGETFNSSIEQNGFRGGERWWKKVQNNTPPIRRMIPCNTRVPVTWIALFRFCQEKQLYRVLVATDQCRWETDEPTDQENSSDLLSIWLREVQAAVQIILETEDLDKVELILVRTNIRKLKKALDKDLYSRSSDCEEIATSIHKLLISEKMKERPPPELRGVLLGGQHRRRCHKHISHPIDVHVANQTKNMREYIGGEDTSTCHIPKMFM